jgi:hypothetical protein
MNTTVRMNSSTTRTQPAAKSSTRSLPSLPESSSGPIDIWSADKARDVKARAHHSSLDTLAPHHHYTPLGHSTSLRHSWWY